MQLLASETPRQEYNAEAKQRMNTKCQRQECSERTNVKAEPRLGQDQILLHDRVSNAVLQRRPQAAESVIPDLLLNDHPIRETETSQRGLNLYLSH